MQDLPVPEPMTKLSLSESVGGLPIPKALGERTDCGSETPVPLPLDRLMELAGTTAETFPVPQPLEQLTNK